MKTFKKVLNIANCLFMIVFAIGLMWGWATLYPGESSTAFVWLIGITAIAYLTFIEIIPTLTSK